MARVSGQNLCSLCVGDITLALALSLCLIQGAECYVILVHVRLQGLTETQISQLLRGKEKCLGGQMLT